MRYNSIIRYYYKKSWVHTWKCVCYVPFMQVSYTRHALPTILWHVSLTIFIAANSTKHLSPVLLRDSDGAWTGSFNRAIGFTHFMAAALWGLRDGPSSIIAQIFWLRNIKSKFSCLHSNPVSYILYQFLVDAWVLFILDFVLFSF